MCFHNYHMLFLLRLCIEHQSHLFQAIGKRVYEVYEQKQLKVAQRSKCLLEHEPVVINDPALLHDLFSAFIRRPNRTSTERGGTSCFCCQAAKNPIISKHLLRDVHDIIRSQIKELRALPVEYVLEIQDVVLHWAFFLSEDNNSL